MNMKKNLLVIICICLAALSVRADLIYNEKFNYSDGGLTNVSAGAWANHSGPGNDMFVKNKRVEISGNSSTNAARTSDQHRDFCTSGGCSFTNALQVLYASFTINCTNLPTTFSNFIAHFYVNSSTFNARVFTPIGNLPSTWRVGVSGGANAVSKILPVDLARNVDYQVVLKWDPTGLNAAQLWVNPISESDPSVITIDTVATPGICTAFAFRQAAGTTSFFAAVSNLVVATTFTEALTNTWATNALPPTIVRNPTAGTNFVGSSVSLAGLAAGQGQSSLIYQWRKGGLDITNPDGNTNVFTIPSVNITDTAAYTLVVSNIYGLTATSTVANLWVTNPPVPPTVIPSTNSAVSVFNHQSTTLAVVASGPPTITYQWYYNNAPAVGANVSDPTQPALTITDVTGTNGTAGAYKCVASNPFGSVTSGVFTVTATAPPSVTIAQLRTMVDPVFFLPTNTTALWQVTGIVTTYTNITTAGNYSGYIQDNTGGINIFFGGAGAVVPQAGDSVTVIGPLGNFNSLLELNLTTTDTAHSIVTNSSGNPLPTPLVLPFSFTNTPSASNAVRFVQGSLVTLTNVYFPTGFAGTNTFGSGGVNVTVTNAAGATFTIRVDSRIGDIIGKQVAPYGWAVTGPMGYFNTATATDRSAGFQLFPTRFADFVIQKPAFIVSPGANPTITWEAGPNVPYSILRADIVEGPYTQIATGLSFPTSAGSYTDTGATSTNGFYKITSP